MKLLTIFALTLLAHSSWATDFPVGEWVTLDAKFTELRSGESTSRIDNCDLGHFKLESIESGRQLSFSQFYFLCVVTGRHTPVRAQVFEALNGKLYLGGVLRGAYGLDFIEFTLPSDDGKSLRRFEMRANSDDRYDVKLRHYSETDSGWYRLLEGTFNN